MNKEQWEKGMENLDDNLLNETISYKKKNNNKKIAVGVASVAAAAALVSGVCLWNGSRIEKTSEQTTTVSENTTAVSNQISQADIVQETTQGNAAVASDKNEANSSEKPGIISNDEIVDDAMAEIPNAEVSKKYMASASVYEYVAGAARKAIKLTDEEFDIFADFAGSTATALYTAGENYIYSPLSLYTALGMLAQCENELGNADLADLMGVKTENMETYVKKLMDSCMADGVGYQFSVANSAWVREHYFGETGINKITGLSNTYQADVASIENSSKATEDIKAWISEKTHGLVDSDINIEERTALVLVNTAYMNSLWNKEIYWDSGEFVFTDAKGNEKRVNCFGDYKAFIYGSEDRYDYVAIPYVDDGYMLIMLPKEGIEPGDLLNNDLCDVVNDIRKGEVKKERVDVCLPEISTSSKIENIRDILLSLGLNESMEIDGFTGLENPEYNSEKVLAVSKIAQNSKLIMNSQGTTVASQTEVVVTKAGSALVEERIEFVANRPFAYAICSANSVIEFMGVINSVE